ncbi:GMC oxidoreductase-domain-containing protein [Lentinula detonsa]|uniref:GMC oxidoreductase-domain-containing protein n=1 Tax=Lentinula detonsa TaxID=2804962 RepID=A0A9W8NWV3_9AGAR|nr:GMC oxidoreductase-domain-containing protein [Lentinula detonsa]
MPFFDTYDIVFARGGTAACIIAGRLAQADPSLKILVTYQAESWALTLNLPARFLNSLIKGHTVSHHRSVQSKALGGRSVCVPSACCVVGGGSAVNFMIYTRPAASDYDDWAKLGNPGQWGSESLIPLARKVETYQEPSGNPSVHGFSGPIKVSKGGCDTNIGREFLETAAPQYDKDREASPSADLNDFQTINVYAPWHKYIDSQTGKRSDTAHHFLYNLANFILDPSESKHNVHVSTNLRVVRRNSRAIGVEYVAREDMNSEHRLQPRMAYASRLVVLSSGAFGSGIGSAKRLAEAVDIRSPQFVDLPGVGENYNDHNLCVTLYLASEDSDCLDAIFSGDEEAIKLESDHLNNGQFRSTSEGVARGRLRASSTQTRDLNCDQPRAPEELEELGPAFKSLQAGCNLGDFHNSPTGCKTFGMNFVTAYPKACVWSGEPESGGRISVTSNLEILSLIFFVDISIAPLNVGANTNSTALVIGEKAFLLIADDLGISLKCTQATREFKGPDV